MKRAVIAASVVILVWLIVESIGHAQVPATVPQLGTSELRNSAMSISTYTLPDLQQWSPRVDTWIRDGTLFRATAYDDSERPGRRHEALIQYYKGVPVYGADVMRQTEGALTVSLFGTVYSDIDLDVSARLTAEQAVEKLDETSNTTRVIATAPALIVLPTLDGRFALAYFAAMKDGFTYFVDANDGRLLQKVDNRKYQNAVGSGRGVLGDTKKISTTQSAGAFRTRDSLRPATILTLDARRRLTNFNRLESGGRWVESDLAADTDNNWTDAAIVDAHAYMGWVYDYFYKTHRYQALDNRNSPMIGVVASRDESDALLDNAFFIPAPYGPDGGGGMFFGESSTGSPMTALDAVSHELTHGVINFALLRRTGRALGSSFPLELGPSSMVVGGRTFSCATSTFAGRPFYCSNGRYVTVSNHAGALNEALADVFGTAVEFAYQPAGSGPLKADYLIGEDIPRPGGFAAPIRSLENPASLVIDPSSGLRFPDNYSRRISFAVIIENGSLAVSPVAIVGGNGVVLGGDDDGAVHLNSTILSHAFYLAIEGGQNRTSGLTVQGVGGANRSQIEQVFFRAIRDLIPSGVTFPQMAAALRQASVDLYGASGAPTRAVDQALNAVGL